MTTINTNSGPRMRFRFLKPDAEGSDTVPFGRSLDEVSLTLPEFHPVEGDVPLSDGEPATKFGQRFRKVFAEHNGIAETDVPHGLIRDVEALSADHDENISALASPLLLRNNAGEQIAVRLIVHTPLVGPFIANGRQQTRLARKVRGRTGLVTGGRGHETLKLPCIDLASADQPLLLAQAQREVENLHAYSGDDRDFIDSIALEGVLTEPVVVPFFMQHATSTSHGFVPQTDDGWRRTTAAQTIMSEILGIDAGMTYRHWHNADGTLTVRDHDAQSVRRTLAALRFSASDQAALLFPSSRHSASVKGWLSSIAYVRADVRAFHRVRTMAIYFVIAARPKAGKTPYDVSYQDMAARHIPALAPRPWEKDATEGLVAIRSIDALRAGGHIGADIREVFIGEKLVQWAGDGSSAPFRDRVVATVSLMASLTTDGDGTRLKCTRNALAEHGMRNHPDERARIAAAQATVVAGLDDDATRAALGQVSACLGATFRHASLWRESAQSRAWSSLIHTPLDDLVALAITELGQHHVAFSDQVGALGPAQRALMALAGVAHTVNPELIKQDNSLTRTGRGGRGGVGKADPIALLMLMVAELDGIKRCGAIVAATAADAPAIPTDPVTGEPMTEEWLRRAYLGGRTGEPLADPTPPSPDPAQDWWNDVNSVLREANRLALSAEEMRQRTVPPELLGVESDQLPAEHAQRMLDRFGIEPGQKEAMDAYLETLRRFFYEGAFIFGMVAARPRGVA